MTIQEITERWISNRKDSQAAVEWWNSKASNYKSKELPTVENNSAMRLINANQMLLPKQTTLDVGCGNGRFSFALEKMGSLVTGTDFSPLMIDECERLKVVRASSVNFCVCDWHEANLQELGWEKSFDLVIAHMTPAIASADTFLKLSKASRNWCLMVKPTRRRNTLLDKITDLLGLPADTKALNEAILYAFELLWLNGMKPKIEYEEQLWKNSLTVEEAIKDYTLRISSFHALSTTQRDAIARFLLDNSIDNEVEETTQTTIAAVYWQV